MLCITSGPHGRFELAMPRRRKCSQSPRLPHVPEIPMSKKSKEKSSSKKDKRSGDVRRQERRFIPQSSTNGMIVRATAALSALLLGAGLWAYFYGQSFAEDEKLSALPVYLIAAGSVLMGVTMWIGTSSESPIRVGAPGIAVEKGELRRMPWWCVESIRFEAGALTLVVTGKDDSNNDWTFKVPVTSHPEAVGWLVKEALERIPRRVDISDDLLDKLPSAAEHAGQRIDLEPLQVVGKRCAATGKTISYEPDARVCPRCERAYLKRSVPKKCKCGNSLADLRPKPVTEEEEDDDESDETLESERELSSSKDLAAKAENETAGS